MRLQRKISKSVRIPKGLQKQIGKEIVRLSLNPAIYEKSGSLVNWNRGTSKPYTPQEIILRAMRAYPEFSLSAAVEAVLFDVLQQQATDLGATRISKDELEQLKRFARLPLLEKIRLTQKRIRLYRMLSGLRWRGNETRKGF